MATHPASKKNVQPPATDFVLPPAPRARGELVVQAEAAAEVTALRREGQVLRRFGERIRALVDCQDRFMTELRSTLAELELAVHEESRARILNQVRVLGEVLDWCAAVQADLGVESARAAAGQQAIDLGELVRTAAQAFAGATAGVTVLGETERPWWGSPERVFELLQTALAVVADRSGDAAGLVVELGEREASHDLRIRGTGEPRDLKRPAVAARLRSLAQELGILLVPDEQGPAGGGLVLRLQAWSPEGASGGRTGS